MATSNGKAASCIRVPPNCGKAGNPACPSNAIKPSRGLDDGMAAKPFCTDGSTAFYSSYPWGNTKAVGVVCVCVCAGALCCPAASPTLTWLAADVHRHG